MPFSGAPKRSQIRDLVPNGTKVPKWSQKSPNFAFKSQISDSTFRWCWKGEAHRSHWPSVIAVPYFDIHNVSCPLFAQNWVPLWLWNSAYAYSRPEPCLQRICRKLSIFIAHFADTVVLYCGMGAMYMPQYYPRHPEQIGNHQWSDVWLDPRLASRLLRPAQQARGPLALERAARLSKSAAPVCEVC